MQIAHQVKRSPEKYGLTGGGTSTSAVTLPSSCDVPCSLPHAEAELAKLGDEVNGRLRVFVADARIKILREIRDMEKELHSRLGHVVPEGLTEKGK